jgi:hypothetical protein
MLWACRHLADDLQTIPPAHGCHTSLLLQLEYMQRTSSSKQGRQQPPRHPAALPAPEALAEPSQPDTSSAQDLPPSAVEAAQACQAGAQSDTDEPSAAAAAAAAAAAVPLPPDDGDLDADLVEEELGQQQQHKHRQQVLGQSPKQQQGGSPDAAAAAAAGPQSTSRQATPACQLPGMSVSQSLCPVTRNFLGCLQHTYTCRWVVVTACIMPAL